MSTTTEQLASVQDAIARLESGAQEVRFADGRMLKYPDLDMLYKRETTLIERQAREQRGGSGIGISRGAAL